MRRILALVPAEDRAGRAISLAGRVAERTGAAVTLLRVLEENLGPAASAEVCQQQTKIRNLLLDVETEQLESMARGLRERIGDVTAHVCWGVPWEVTLREARSGDFDLIVKPASGLSHSGRVFFGSTALHLFRRASCPVWVVGGEGVLPDRILAAVDPTGGAGRQQAARRIVDCALAVAELSGAEVHLATAWHAIGAELLSETLEEEEWTTYRRETEQVSRECLDRLVETLDDAVSPDAVHLIEGEAREALPRFADEQDFDLIVMGTLSRPGEVGDLLGETAETVLRGVHSSVMTIPPAASHEGDAE